MMEDKEKKTIKIDWAKAIRLLCEYFEKKPSEQALLTEYQVCREHSNAITSQFWTSMSVYLSINLLVIGGMVGSIINRGHLPPYTEWLVLSIGLASLFIALFLRGWQQRVQSQNELNNLRMRQIEGDIPDILITRRQKAYDDNNLKDKVLTPHTRKEQALWKFWLPCINFLKRLLRRKNPTLANEKYLWVRPRAWTIDAIFCVIAILWIIIIAMSFFIFDG